jgi:uncharacterized protein YjaG (DUF416 family)
MSPHDIIYNVLERSVGFNEADKLTTEILERLATQGFVAVHARAVTQQDGKVTVSRELVESVLEDAEAFVASEYVINGEVHRSERRRYFRDMDDIWKLKAELREVNGE